MRGNASSFPSRPEGSVGMDSGDAEEDVGLANTEILGWVGGSIGGLSHDHGAAKVPHDVNKLLRGTGSCLAGQDDETLLGAIPFA